MEKPSKETCEQGHQDPDNWKFGVFYYNPDDKRIFPPRKDEGRPGWTPNFGNWQSILAWLIVLGLFFTMKDFLLKHNW